MKYKICFSLLTWDSICSKLLQKCVAVKEKQEGELFLTESFHLLNKKEIRAVRGSCKLEFLLFCMFIQGIRHTQWRWRAGKASCCCPGVTSDGEIRDSAGASVSSWTVERDNCFWAQDNLVLDPGFTVYRLYKFKLNFLRLSYLIYKMATNLEETIAVPIRTIQNGMSKSNMMKVSEIFNRPGGRWQIKSVASHLLLAEFLGGCCSNGFTFWNIDVYMRFSLGGGVCAK